MVRAIAAIVAATSLCGACGGDGPLSHHAHAREASQICRRLSAHADDTVLPDFDRPRDAARAIEQEVERQRGVLAELRDLEPPKVETTAVVRWLALIDQLLDEAELMVDQLRGDDPARALETAARLAALDARGRMLAREQDIHPCRFPYVAVSADG